MYYNWVHENFMRGEIFLQRDENDQFVYPDGVGFQNPFKKGSCPDLLHIPRMYARTIVEHYARICGRDNGHKALCPLSTEMVALQMD